MNRKLLVLVACVVVGSIVQMQPIEACSAFGLKGDEVRLMAVDYDWEVPGGRLIVNPRAVEKTALVSPEATLERSRYRVPLT